MQDEAPCKDNEKQLIKTDTAPFKMSYGHKPLNDHFYFNWKILEEPLGPGHEKFS